MNTYTVIFFFLFSWGGSVAYSQSIPDIYVDTTKYHTILYWSLNGKYKKIESYENVIRLVVDEKIDTVNYTFNNPLTYDLYHPVAYNTFDRVFALDLASYSTSSVDFYLPRDTYFNGLYGNGLLLLGVNGGDIDRSNEVQHDGGLLYHQELTTKIWQLDLDAEKANLLFDMNGQLPVSEDADISKVYHCRDSENLLIETSIYESADRYGIEYFLYNTTSNEVTHFSAFKSLSIDFKNVRARDSFYDVSGRFIFIPVNQQNYSDVILHKKQPFNKVLLFDHNFNYLQECLPRRMRIMGYNYENDTAVSINLKSTLDTKKSQWDDDLTEAIIAYRLTVPVEKALYAIYRNHALSAYDLAQLTLQQLRLVKNMIYARHNYQFDSPYYQAFFNLFDFYNTEAMRQRRTKTMEGQLTRHDVQNARLIKQIMDRRK